MLKAQPLCSGMELSLEERDFGEKEKNSFIALAGEWDTTHSGFMPAKLCVASWGDLVRRLIILVQGQSCCKDQGVCRAYIPFIWPQVVS